MTFSYSGNPASSDLDAVRFLIKDTVVNTETNLSNEEITWLLSTWIDIYESASAGAEHLAATFSSLSDTSKSVGDISISKTYSNQAQQYYDLAKRLRAQRVRLKGPIPIINPEAIESTARRQPFTPTTDFFVGQFDNPGSVSDLSVITAE